MNDQQNKSEHPQISFHEIEKAIKISYVQAMLSAIYMTLIGGMFIIGFALKLGANNAQIGLMTTLPMLCVIAQLYSSMLVERGVSRRILVTWTCVVFSLGWPLVMLIPYVLKHSPTSIQVGVFIALITTLTLFLHIASNARSSWVSDLVPISRRGEFFGRNSMYANIIATLFSIGGGSFLDHAKSGDISAYMWIFFTAGFIGLINAVLHLPQPDVPLRKHEDSHRMIVMIRETFVNKDLMRVVAFVVVWSMQAISAPFVATYLLRDLHVPYVGVGALTAVATVAVLLSSSFWGRMVDKYGSRPILILCTSIVAFIPFVWIWVTSAARAYYLLGLANIIGGFTIGGITVALSPLIFKVTPKSGRSVQLAMYSIIVTLCAAPMPALGGYLPDWFKSIGLNADLRCTFWTAQAMAFTSIFFARKIRESDSRHTGELARNLPKHLMGAKQK